MGRYYVSVPGKGVLIDASTPQEAARSFLLTYSVYKEKLTVVEVEDSEPFKHSPKQKFEYQVTHLGTLKE
jgi:hypothetical protein